MERGVWKWDVLWSPKIHIICSTILSKTRIEIIISWVSRSLRASDKIFYWQLLCSEIFLHVHTALWWTHFITCIKSYYTHFHGCSERGAWEVCILVISQSHTLRFSAGCVSNSGSHANLKLLAFSICWLKVLAFSVFSVVNVDPQCY